VVAIQRYFDHLRMYDELSRPSSRSSCNGCARYSIYVTALVSVFYLIILVFNHPSAIVGLPSTSNSSTDVTATCTPEQWSHGNWVKSGTILSAERTVFEASGFAGCRSTFVPSWHLGTGKDMSMSDYRRRAVGWSWRSSTESCREKNISVQSFIQDLITQGGWLLVGGTLVYDVSSSARDLRWGLTLKGRTDRFDFGRALLFVIVFTLRSCTSYSRPPETISIDERSCGTSASLFRSSIALNPIPKYAIRF
jgi:hypothetical protein